MLGNDPVVKENALFANTLDSHKIMTYKQKRSSLLVDHASDPVNTLGLKKKVSHRQCFIKYKNVWFYSCSD